MGVANQLRNIDRHFAVIEEFPMYAKTPIVIGESDPEGCAACGVRHYPQNGYRNGTMFPTYTALQIARTYELADLHGVNLLGAVTWAFLFEDQPYFDGFRDLATNGIAKPVLNTFRMLGQMRGNRVQAVSSAASRWRDSRRRRAGRARHLGAGRAFPAVGHGPGVELPRRRPARAGGVRPADDPGLPAGRATVTHHRIDENHSNSYSAWVRMGSPQQPTPAQYADLERASELQELTPARA